MKACECCGHPVVEYDTLRGLTPAQQRIFNIVEKAGQAGITRKQLFDAMYSDDPNGGPDNPNVLNVQRVKMQYALEKHGLKITTTGGHYATWRIEKL